MSDGDKIATAAGVPVPKTLDDNAEQTVVMGVASAGPTVGGHIPAAAGQEWSTGVCDCTTDSGSCWDVCLCGTCMLAKQFNKVFNDRNTINWPVCAGVLISDLLCTGGLALLAEAMVVRFRVRQRYGISSAADHSDEGSCLDFFKEFCLVLWCTPCTTCQNHREMTLHGDWPGAILFGSDPALASIDAPTQATMQ